MNIIHTQKKDLITSKWSGGTTTQLAIYPPGSTLAERNFLFRISTATVEAESSAFTILPGVRRIIMVLDGILELEHTGHYSRRLKKPETDSFLGDWETRSRGRVVDFNLMTTGNAVGTIKLITISPDQSFRITSSKADTAFGIYPLKGNLVYHDDKEKSVIEAGDFFLFLKSKVGQALTIHGSGECEFVFVRIEIS